MLSLSLQGGTSRGEGDYDPTPYVSQQMFPATVTTRTVLLADTVSQRGSNVESTGSPTSTDKAPDVSAQSLCVLATLTRPRQRHRSAGTRLQDCRPSLIRDRAHDSEISCVTGARSRSLRQMLSSCCSRQTYSEVENPSMDLSIGELPNWPECGVF